MHILYVNILHVSSEVSRVFVHDLCLPSRQVLRQRSATVAEAQRSAQSAQTERATVEERLRGLQRAVAMLETEKKDAERQAVRLEKDKNALRNTLDKVSNCSLCTTKCATCFIQSLLYKEPLVETKIQSSCALWTHVGFHQ